MGGEWWNLETQENNMLSLESTARVAVCYPASKTFVTQPLSLVSKAENLRSICLVHRLSWATILHSVVLILKFLPIDGPAIMVCEVTALAHESWNDFVQGGILFPYLFCGVLTVWKLCKWAKGDTIVSYVREHLGVDHGCQQVAIGNISVCKLAIAY